MRILIVEDEKKVAGFIKKGFEEETYAVDVVYDGEEGLYLGRENSYDLIVLDIMLPKLNGLEVLTQLRKEKNETPILLLTAKDSVDYLGRYASQVSVIPEAGDRELFGWLSPGTNKFSLLNNSNGKK